MKYSDPTVLTSQATRDAERARLKELLRRGVDPNAADPAGMPRLVGATLIRDCQLVQLLLQHQANVNIRDSAGMTALAWAAFHGLRDIAARLLASRADVNLVDKLGRTPLMYAAMMDRVPLMEELLAHQADLKLRDTAGRTALVFAAMAGRTSACAALLQSATRLQCSDQNSATALTEARPQRSCGHRGGAARGEFLGAEPTAQSPPQALEVPAATVSGLRNGTLLCGCGGGCAVLALAQSLACPLEQEQMYCPRA